MADIQTAPQWATGMGGRDERVIYYRRKNGWITWGDTQASKQLMMIQKGATPLPQFGYITDSKDLWGPILRHPEGPAMFPVEQVLTYRWYRDCPVQCKFPQLAGVKITEFPCPECARSFHSPLHLGSHLRVMHAYDRSEVLKYGEAMHIDFSKIPGGKEVIEYDFAKAEEAKQEVEQDMEYAVETISAETPASTATVAELESAVLRCGDCDYTTEGKTKHAFALEAHRRAKHELVPA